MRCIPRMQMMHRSHHVVRKKRRILIESVSRLNLVMHVVTQSLTYDRRYFTVTRNTTLPTLSSKTSNLAIANKSRLTCAHNTSRESKPNSNSVILACGLEITQGHSNWYHSKAWMLFPIRLPYLTVALFCIVCEI